MTTQNVTITGAAGEEIEISEHYITQLKDSVTWLEFARNSEDNTDKRAQLTKELEEAQSQLDRLQPLFG